MAGFCVQLHRGIGGCGIKACRDGTLPLRFLADTKAVNLTTYLRPWPRHLTTFLCYGTSRRMPSPGMPLVRGSLVRGPQALRARPYVSVPEKAIRESSAWREDGDAGQLPPAREGSPPAAAHEDAAAQPKSTVAAAVVSGPAATTAIEQPVAATEQLAAAAAQPAAAKARAAIKKVGLRQLQAMYERREPISVLTAYDYLSARLADEAGADIVLVGDSLGMVVLGHEDTTEVTVDQMVHHCQAAARGTRRALLVGDLPFGSYLTPDEAARSGVQLLKHGRVDAVKLEGGTRVLAQVRALVDAGIAVMGHIGLTPQSHMALGGYGVQGRTAADAASLLEEARALKEAGCFSVVLEMVPAAVAQMITERLSLPTIGIGAGPGTSGQVQVFHDVLGLYDRKKPRFSRQFADLEQPMLSALTDYCSAVKSRAFPAPQHSFVMTPQELQNMHAELQPSLHPPLARRPRLLRSVAEWRALYSQGLLSKETPLALVPTMGALHAGHLHLVSQAKAAGGLVAVSIFVNPKQFNDNEDLDKYPRTFEDDIEKLTRAGVDLVFAPSAQEMYPPAEHGLAPFVDLEGVDALPEAAHRPGHFRGVATVVTKLLNIIQPQVVHFGQKDGLQCVVARRLVDGLNFNTKVEVHPTVREEDGLALSSRNRFLSNSERSVAPLVYDALRCLGEAARAGEAHCEALRQLAAAVIATDPQLELEYVSVASEEDGKELEELSAGGPGAFASIAVRLGSTRLIDTLRLDRPLASK
tara:strand:+ start:416 stop:2677 length:2262 start_codon:yes stop_codon:yes gene_type:complete